MGNKNTDLMVGLFVILGGLALLFMALRAGNLASFSLTSHTYQVRARFDSIGGLKARAPVRSAGVVVGRVSKIDFDNAAYQASVTVDISERFHFPKDTSASILTSGLLGEQYIGLDPGADTQMLASGDVITSTQSAIVLETLISKFLFGKVADAAPPPPATGAQPAGAKAKP